MVAPTCFGITLPSSGSVPSAFWEKLNWGAVDRILWMGVLCLVTWCVTIWDNHAPRRIYSMIWVKSGTREVHLISLGSVDFSGNRRRVSRAFLNRRTSAKLSVLRHALASCNNAHLYQQRDNSALICIRSYVLRLNMTLRAETCNKIVYRVTRMHTINLLRTERRPLYLKAQSVPRCKHFSSRL
jgi:hypothetical protein